MRFQVNLSHQPFYNRRLFWLVILAVLVITGFVGAWTLKKIDESAGKIQELQTKITEQNLHLKDLRKKQPVKAQALTEDQIEQLQAAAFLIEQRSFSWTAMLEEFERSLPPNVRIVNITLKGNKLDKLDKLEKNNTPGLLFSVKVLTKSPEDVTKMIAKMDQRGIFRIQPNAQLAPNPAGDIGFDLDVNYVPPQPQARPVARKVSEKQFAKGGEGVK